MKTIEMTKMSLQSKSSDEFGRKKDNQSAASWDGWEGSQKHFISEKSKEKHGRHQHGLPNVVIWPVDH